MESFSFPEKKETSNKKIINAFEFSPREELKLKESIHLNSGTIRVFIHPYYSADMYLGDSGTIDRNDQKIMQDGFEKLIKIVGDEKTPIFVFEEKNHIQDLNTHLKTLLGRNIYLIPTQKDTSTPYLNEITVKDFFDEDEKAWNHLRDKFKEWGVEKITLGGQSLAMEFDEETLSNNPYQFEGCAGQAIFELKDTFNVEVSRFSYPIHRNQYNKYRNYDINSEKLE